MSRDLTDLRLEYTAGALAESDLHQDPVRQFESWFQKALELDMVMANAMVVATADENGRPSARYVLLKEYNSDGFIFYTHSRSRKGLEISKNPHAALVFYWRELHRQIRIEGRVEILSAERADRYFASRPRGSQISAWAAIQSQVISGRDYLQDRVQELSRKYLDRPVPRPDTWVGYLVRPDSMEFWQGQENRLHDRLIYQRGQDGTWKISRLAP